MALKLSELFREILQRRRRDRESGSVVVIAALALPVILGVAALAAEYGTGLVRQVENQRIADSAAFAAATWFAQSSSSEEMLGVARQVAAYHGVAAEDVIVQLTAAPGSGAQAVMVQINTRHALFLAPLFGIGPFLNVSAQSFAGLGESAGDCIIALSPSGPGLVMSGSASVIANNCNVASNHTVTAPCSTSITATAITYGVTPNPCASPVNLMGPDGGPAPTSQAMVADPLISDPGLAVLRNRINYLDNVQWRPGADMARMAHELLFLPYADPDWSYLGCETEYTPRFSRWVFNCPEYEFYRISDFALEGDGRASLEFNLGGHPDSVYYFVSPVVLDAVGVRFGPGTYHFYNGLKLMNGATASFQQGNLHFGNIYEGEDCTETVRAGICVIGKSELHFFSDSSDIAIYSGLYASENSLVGIGDGGINSLYVGVMLDDRNRLTSQSIYIESGAQLTVADATRMANSITIMGNVETRDQTCFTFGAAANHDLRGNMELNGSTRLGAGVYTLGGYFAVGTQAAGPTRCWGRRIGLDGKQVTIVVNGRSQITSGVCAGASFCIAAGFNNFGLTAPTSGPYKSLAIVGPSGNSTSAVINGSSAMSLLRGIVYYPNGPVRFASASSGGGTPDNCLQIIGLDVNLTAPGNVVSECISTGGGVSRVSLIQ